MFCCAGGAAYGYHLAGFEVVGCDIAPQPHYPFKMFVDDALNCIRTLLKGETWNGYKLSDFTMIHASPECKGYTNSNLSPKELYQKLIAPVRELLIKTGLPWVIENVLGAKHHMSASVLLCGSMFGLRMQRHRLFEISFASEVWLCPPRTCDHRNATINVYGHSVWDSSLEGTRRKDGRRRPDSVAAEIGRNAMGINWMNKEELAEALPPVYTEWIGQQLLVYLERVAA